MAKAQIVEGPWESPTLPPEPAPRPARHIRIPKDLVPWRAVEYEASLCGRRGKRTLFVDNMDDATCSSCIYRIPGLHLIMESPFSRVKEAIKRERDPRLLSAEFHSLGILAERHREEFDLLVNLRLSQLESEVQDHAG